MQSVNKLVENYASPSDTGTGAKTFDEIRTDDTEIEKLFKNADQDRVEVENLANSIQETKVAYEELHAEVKEGTNEFTTLMEGCQQDTEGLAKEFIALQESGPFTVAEQEEIKEIDTLLKELTENAGQNS